MTERTLIFLPLDILINIFKYLDISDFRNLMLTCKTLKAIIVNDSFLWRLKSKQHVIIKCKSDVMTGYNRCRISHNWCRGIFKNMIVLQHNTNYMPWLKYDNPNALFLSTGENLHCYLLSKKDFRLKHVLWRITVPTVRRYDIRTNDISRFIYKRDLLVCGNRDGSVAVYRLNNWKETPILLTHIKDCHNDGQAEVSAVETVGDVVATSSQNAPCICLWKVNDDSSYSKTEVALSDILGCRSLATNSSDTWLAIGLNGNCKPLLLDVATCKPLLSPCEKVTNARQVVRDVQWRDGNTFVYVSHLGKLSMTDVRTGGVVYETMDPFQSPLYCVKTDQDRSVVVGSAEYTRCVLFDLRKTTHVQMYFTQKKMSPVYSLDFDTSRLFAAADRAVSALNFNVCSATTPLRDYSSSFECIF